MSVVRLRLEDQGEGWFWDGTSIDVDVLDEVRMHSRLFYRVAFAEAVEAREAGGEGRSGRRQRVVHRRLAVAALGGPRGRTRRRRQRAAVDGP